ncbi:MAG TPA: acyl-CoA thioesterase II [Roseiarcus sp.]|nr:acyl-CoA thioesterase II [Roseiarcus sp.]
MPRNADDLVALLDLEKIEEDIFRGLSPANGWKRTFGGQVIAQALMAATRTVDPSRAAHSLHGYFILPGDPEAPIIYEVDRIRDGGSFTTRRVVAVQHGKAIFSLSASFHVAESGFEHFIPAPDVPDPERLIDAGALMRAAGLKPEQVERFIDRISPVEFRPVDPSRHAPLKSGEKREPSQALWIRINSPLPDDPIIHRAALAFLSDMTLLGTSVVAHGRNLGEPEIQAASLDHALWLHRPFRADEWLLYAQDSPSAGGARGFNRGLLYSRDRTLVASVAQEGLIRKRTGDKARRHLPSS